MVYVPAYTRLNNSVLNQINKALKDDPGTDLEPILQKLFSSYSGLRHKVQEQENKRFRKGNENDLQGKANLTRRSAPIIPHLGSLSVVIPLSQKLPSLCSHTGEPSELHSSLLHLLSSGKTLWHQHSRAVIEIATDMIAKIGPDTDEDETAVLQFLASHAPDVPVPIPYGLARIGSTSIFFMSRIPGCTLEERWPALTHVQKRAVQEDLQDMLTRLRNLPLPPQYLLGGLSRHVCKDTRMTTRVSTTAMHSMVEFNDFLTSTLHPRITRSYCHWLRSLLRDNHSIVLTHGDLHPRNTMVTDTSEGRLIITGIIDWEMAGFYPEYWEALKARNTRDTKDTSDWWDYLPPAISGYGDEIAVDRLIERAMQ